MIKLLAYLFFAFLFFFVIYVLCQVIKDRSVKPFLKILLLYSYISWVVGFFSLLGLGIIVLGSLFGLMIGEDRLLFEHYYMTSLVMFILCINAYLTFNWMAFLNEKKVENPKL